MAGVNIKVELDDKGVAQGTQRVENQFKQMETNLQQVGQRGNVVFTEMVQKQQQVQQAAEQMGRAVVDSMGGINSGAASATSAMAGMIPVLGLIGAAVIIHRDRIREIASAWGGNTSALREYYDYLVQVNDQTISKFKTHDAGVVELTRLTNQQKEIQQQRAALVQLSDKLGGLGGIGAAAKLTLNATVLNDLDKQLAVIDKKIAAAQERVQAIDEKDNKTAESEAAKAQREFEAAQRKREQAMKNLIAIGDQWAGKGVEQGQQVDHSFVMAYQHALEEAQKSGASQEQIQAALTKVIAGYSRERGEVAEKEADQAISAAQRAEKERQASAKRTTRDLAQEAEARQRLDAQTEYLNEQAVALRTPVWARGLQQIEAEHTRVMERIRRESEKLPANDASVLDARNAEWARYDAALADEHRQMTEQLASDLGSAFDDLTSGKLGERILNNFKKLMFLLIAQSLEASGIMKSGIGSIFRGAVSGDWSSALQGGGASGGSIFGGGMATTPGFNGAPVGASGGIIPGMPGLGSFLSGGSSAPFVAGNGGAIPDTRAPFDIFGQATGAVAGGGAKLNIKGLAGAAGGLLAAGLGGNIGSIGAMMTALAMTDKLKGTNLGKALGYAGAGISGFGIGMNSGKVGGVLGGALSGALSLAPAGPMGMLIGGIIGGLGGLFGGFVGGSQRSKQANIFASGVEGQIFQIETAYKGHQTDYSSAIGALTQIQQDAMTQLDGLKGEGKKTFSRRIQPDIAKAITEIEQIESERQRRGGLVFSPPQFASGGFVGGGQLSGWRMSNGAVAAIVHEGEYVVNRQATAKNRGALESMNAGGSGGGGGDVVYINAADAASFKAMLLKNGGWEGLKEANRQKKREGQQL